MKKKIILGTVSLLVMGGMVGGVVWKYLDFQSQVSELEKDLHLSQINLDVSKEDNRIANESLEILGSKLSETEEGKKLVEEAKIKADANTAAQRARANTAEGSLATTKSQLATTNSQLNTANQDLASKRNELNTVNSQLSTMNSNLASVNSQLNSANSSLAATNRCLNRFSDVKRSIKTYQDYQVRQSEYINDADDAYNAGNYPLLMQI